MPSGVLDPGLELVQGLFTPSGMAHRKDNSQGTKHIAYLNELLNRPKDFENAIQLVYAGLGAADITTRYEENRSRARRVAEPRLFSVLWTKILGCLEWPTVSVGNLPRCGNRAPGSLMPENAI